MSEQLLHIINNPLLKLVVKLLDMVTFYVGFMLRETLTLSNRRLFVWKSSNFADSYWFLYNDKTSLHDNTIIR